MGLFDLFKSNKKPQPSAPVIEARRDITCGDSRGRFFRAQLEQGKWQKVYEMLLKIEDRVLLDEYIGICADWDGRPAWIDEMTAACPDQPLTWLIRGEHSMVWAWEARGSGTADTVGKDGAQLFIERLKQSGDEFHRAIELNPDDPIPWSSMVTVAQGLNFPVEDRVGFFQQAYARSPVHLPAFRGIIGAVTAKWGGSNELMFDIARQSSVSAPAKSPLHSLIAQAHIERWLYHRMCKEMDAAKVYFEQPDVTRELIAAHERYDGYAADVNGNRVANLFAFCFWQMGKRRLALREFEKTGGIFAGSPWTYLGNPLANFKKARDWAKG